MTPTTHSWDPDRYLSFADERGRPFVEMVGRIDAETPSAVVDLGCGPGNLTELLAQRWPEARISGIDSSPEMIARARAAGGSVGYDVADLREWAAVTPARSVDVLVSNATLQWVPGHLDLLPALVATLRPGGWFAFQVPGNLEEPSHTIRRDLAAEPPYADKTAGVAYPNAYAARTYLHLLADLGCQVDAWETTYLHVLHGADPVFTWVSGTGARPTLQALGAPGEPLREQYESEFKRRLAAAYPDEGHGVVLPFRRVFAVAHLAGDGS